MADFRAVLALAPEHVEARVELAAELQRSGRASDALAELEGIENASVFRISAPTPSADSSAGPTDSLLAGNPTRMEPRILRVRARCLAALGRFADANAAYLAAAGGEIEPVELLAERVAMMERSGTTVQEGAELALEALQAWLDAAGADAPPAFQLRALDFEERLGRIDAALARADRMIEAAPRKELPLVRRADLLERAGRDAEAKADLRRALEAIRSLPPARRSSPATSQLERRIVIRLGGEQ